MAAEGVSQKKGVFPDRAVAKPGATYRSPEFFAQGFAASGKWVRSRGSPVGPANLWVCGEAMLQENVQTAIKAMAARILRETAYILSSPARTSNPPQTVLERILPGGRQPEAVQRMVDPRSGTIGRDEDLETKPAQMFLEEF